MKKTVWLIGVAAVALTMLTDCMPSHSNAQNRLMWALNPEDGSYLEADGLVNLFSNDKVTWADQLKGTTCIVDLPLTATDTRPKEEVNYVGSGSSSIMKFQLSASADTLPHTIGTVIIDWHESFWGIAHPGKRWTDTCYVESRGKGVYTLYRYDEQTVPHREGMVLLVYPGADSILIHRGSEETKRIFKTNQKHENDGIL